MDGTILLMIGLIGFLGWTILVYLYAFKCAAEHFEELDYAEEIDAYEAEKRNTKRGAATNGTIIAFPQRARAN